MQQRDVTFIFDKNYQRQQIFIFEGSINSNVESSTNSE